jgi:hypothetical protein
MLVGALKLLIDENAPGNYSGISFTCSGSPSVTCPQVAGSALHVAGVN